MPTTSDIFIGGQGAYAASRDGRVIAGTGIDARRVEQAAIWQRGTEWRLLGSIRPNPVPCGEQLSSTFDTSDAGNVIVGLAWWDGCTVGHAFRWEESTGMVDLGSTVANRSTRANGVSGDGKIVVGWQQRTDGVRRAARWIGGRQELFQGPGGSVGEAYAANKDGSIIVGQDCRPSDVNPLDQSAWIWTAAEGLQCVPVPGRRLNAEGMMLTTSDDGRVIGGGHGDGLDSEAVLWIDRKPAYLKDYLRANGVPNAFERWVNTGFITAMTPDGRVLVGFGAGPRDFQGYLVILGSDAKMP
jgi:probable HAF family extracellular repeat protein